MVSRKRARGGHADRWFLARRLTDWRRSVLWLSCTPALASAASAAPPCATWPAASPAEAASGRPVRATDIVSLRDFGDLGVLATAPFVALSPDSRSIALILRQARPDSNDYCSALILLPVDGGAPPRAIADAGPVTPMTFDKYGISGVDLGAPKLFPVRWSPDGQWIAWVKEVRGQGEIWRVRSDGRELTRIATSPVPIDDLAWTADDSGLIFRNRPALVAARAAIEHEGLTGYHYDGRFWPLASAAPSVPLPVPVVTQVVDVPSGIVREANATERLRLDPEPQTDLPKGAARFAVSRTGDRMAWTAPPVVGSVGQPLALHVRVRGRDVSCAGVQCDDVVGLWWLADGKTLLILRREGVARSLTGLYRWRPGERTAHPLLITRDALFGCQMDGAALLCAQEGATQPRRLVAIDAGNGRMRAVFDPNPAWKDLELGAVERLSWHNAMGVETFGDLVLPPNYRPGTRLPLIVVQYESRGLLRGGTADDYPIQLYAAHGFAVLSFNRPPWSALQGPPRPLGDFLRANQRDWSDRRSVQSSLETIIAQLAARGIIDPAKVGITGQSDGASTATFALIHSKLFAAAAISTCCEDANIMSSLGSGFADFYHTTGYPLAGDPAPGFWSESALALHADHHPVPLLIQASDQEVRMALPTYATLKNAGWPIEMYVFPGEAHVKFQPAHRLAVYERSLAWFERWLQPGGPEGQTAMSLLPDDGPSAYGQDAAHASTSAN